jgi:hypothetical protein
MYPLTPASLPLWKGQLLWPMKNFSTQIELAQPHSTLPWVSCPLRSISCTFLILISWIFIILPVSSLSPSYLWRFKIRETYKPGSADITHHVSSGDCPPTGCSWVLTTLFTAKSIVPHPVGIDINLPYICFLFDQTQPHCKKGAKWSEEYGGCPYWSCRKHWISEKCPIGSTVGAHCNDSGFFLYISDPWHQHWQDGVKGSMYYLDTSSRPSGTLFISREWVMAPNHR